MHGDADDARAGEARELGVLELLAQGPGYQVPGGQVPLRQAGQRGGAADRALQRDLHHRQHVRQRILRLAPLAEHMRPHRPKVISGFSDWGCALLLCSCADTVRGTQAYV